MKGIILAGGKSSRLYPITKSFTKHLLPIYDKPMIYYPLSVLMLAGIRDILIITRSSEITLYKSLLDDGSKLGIKISYESQPTAKGIADAFIIGEKFIGNDSVCLILGDNLFYGQNLSNILSEASNKIDKATIFSYHVKNPESFGILEFDKENKVKGITEKPQHPKSNFAIPGIYFYPNSVVKFAKSLVPSSRGEIEITDLNNVYLSKGQLNVIQMSRGMAWLDTGTPEALLVANNFVHLIQSRQGLSIGCIEEIAWRKGFINYSELIILGQNLIDTEYGKYICSLKEDN